MTARVESNTSRPASTPVLKATWSQVSAVRTTGWGANAGAVTWINHAAPATGLVSALNSLVGSTPGDLVDAVRGAILDETGIQTELSTTGGTSDGRFIARICPQVIEFGPVNAMIHKIDEHLAVAEIEPLKNIYRRTLERLNASLAP